MKERHEYWAFNIAFVIGVVGIGLLVSGCDVYTELKKLDKKVSKGVCNMPMGLSEQCNRYINGSINSARTSPDLPHIKCCWIEERHSVKDGYYNTEICKKVDKVTDKINKHNYTKRSCFLNSGTWRKYD